MMLASLYCQGVCIIYYAHPLLCLLLSIGFTCMFKHCYIPQCMINSVIVPLIKNKCGDQTDKNNYRPIALSSIISKVFEHVIAERLEVYLWTNDNQFGFKSGHSTDLCIYALTELIEYFKSRSTSVYVAFLDASIRHLIRLVTGHYLRNLLIDVCHYI